MLKFEHTEVLGWEAAIRGMRNPMNSWEKSDSGWNTIYDVDDDEEKSKYLLVKEEGDYEYFLGPNDQDLMTRLRNAGTDHRKFMRMIVVYVDITGPLYWWKEFDTYKVGTVANSCSTMHKIAAKEFTLEDFSHEHLFELGHNVEFANIPVYNGEFWDAKLILEIVIKSLNFYRKKYNESTEKLKREDLTEAERRHVTSQQKRYWWQMIQLLPTSYNQKRTVMLNYEVLANIAKEGSRRHHKLDEWRVDFMNWIRTLPYNELIFGEKSTDKE